MRVLFINNDGGGFADFVELTPSTTIEQFFRERMPHGKPQDFLIRVNRQVVATGQELHDGDRISITATKIEGAA